MSAHRTPCLPLLLAALSLLLPACGGGGGAGGAPAAAGRGSTLTPGIPGMAGIYWDLKNGIIRTDLPGGVPPVVEPIAGSYQNPSYPVLDFEYPPGWSPVTLPLQGGAGVSLVRSDNRAVWRWLGATVPAGTTPAQVRDAEIALLVQTFGIQGEVRTLARNEATVSPAPGITQRASNVIVEVGGVTAQIVVQVNHVDGLGASQAYVEVGAGPSAEYEALCAGLFVPLHFRLLFTNGQDNLSDSDGDGVRDGLDRAPFDPTIQ